MRLLILDGSRILASLVQRIVPEDVEIDEVCSFEEAMTRLAERPPDAVIADLGRSEFPWDELKAYCQNHKPKIPVLFESTVHRTPEEAGIGGLNHTASFLVKPYHVEELRAHIRRLVNESGGGAGRYCPPDTGTPRRRGG